MDMGYRNGYGHKYRYRYRHRNRDRTGTEMEIATEVHIWSRGAPRPPPMVLPCGCSVGSLFPLWGVVGFWALGIISLSF